MPALQSLKRVLVTGVNQATIQDYEAIAGTLEEAQAAQAAMDAERVASESDDGAFQTLMQTAAARLTQIQNQAATIATQADAMATITLSGTTAQQFTQIRDAFRQIGTGTALLARMHTDEAEILRYLGRIVKRVRGLP